jgi:hypothetical protein
MMMAPSPQLRADLAWSAGDWWAKARPPLWQYLVVCVKGDELISAPKGVCPRHSRLFLLQSGTF